MKMSWEEMKQYVRDKKLYREEEEPEYKCKICKDVGSILVVDEYGHEYGKECECRTKKKIEEKKEHSGLGLIYRDKNFSNYKVSKNYQADAKIKAFKYCENFPKTGASLMLCGKSGCGKTHLAVAVINELMEKNFSCKYVEYVDMVNNLKHNFKDDTKYFSRMDEYKEPDVLVIDDFLKGKVTDTDRRNIFQIINKRYVDKKAVIVVTGWSMEEFSRIDEQVYSRIYEMCQGNVINFGEECINYRYTDEVNKG